MWAMIVKEFLELRRDRRTMAMIIVLPLVLLVVFGYAASFNVNDISTRVVGPRADQVAAELRGPFDVEGVDPAADEAAARDMLRDGDADVVVVTGTGPSTALVDGSQLFSAQTAVAAAAKSDGRLRPDVLYNPDLKTSWVMVPALIGMILTFIGTIITSIGLVRERQAGTLEQLAVMPFRPSDVIVGKIAPYFVLAAVDMVIVAVVGSLLFDVPFIGSPLIFVVGGALFLFTVLGIGVLISTVSQNQGQATQLALMTMLPQILLSGMIFPLESMAAGVRWIGYLLPLTYFIQIANGTMLRAAPISAQWIPLVVLAGMATLVFTAAVLRFRRDLAPRRRATPPSGPERTAPLAGAR
ncbi:ABC transporter permease [Actinomadura spongiicola]|uniref:ABC transporter permease n=1 Tax=Actinomadura spongiicola TaxID=2303421 RepID=A0A372GHB6_9ACTN|nr:ABC transporter permease [Actinomadura spongiicola]RFS84775.1 ABC transporter permease [Actinomadura spongiicola]